MSASSVISDSLRTKLKNGGTSTVIIKMSKETQSALDAVEATEFATREDRATAVTKALQSLAAESQKELIKYLDEQKVAYKSLWISNTLVVYEAKLELLEKLETLGGIAEIREEKTAQTMGAAGK